MKKPWRDICISTKTKDYDWLRETWDSFCEYTVFKRTTYYLFGIPVWKKDHSFEDKPVTDYLRRHIG